MLTIRAVKIKKKKQKTLFTPQDPQGQSPKDPLAEHSESSAATKLTDIFPKRDPLQTGVGQAWFMVDFPEERVSK